MIDFIPLILHASVVMFLVGLSLYVSQLSSLICKVVSAITVLTLIFYFGTSILPAFDISCPYRIPSMFSLAQFLLYVFRATNSAFLRCRCTLTGRPRYVPRPWMSRQSLKVAEQSEVFNKYKNLGVAHYLEVVYLTTHLIIQYKQVMCNNNNPAVQENPLSRLNHLSPCPILSLPTLPPRPSTTTTTRQNLPWSWEPIPQFLHKFYAHPTLPRVRLVLHLLRVYTTAIVV